DARLAEPCDMPQRIRDWCRDSGQRVPAQRGEIIRCALESLALKSRLVIEVLERLTQRAIRRVHIVGGGARNDLLCQLTADATGRPVHAGPFEATAIGNILIQAMALKQIASLAEIRDIVARSFECATYEPREASRWNAAVDRFQSVLRNSETVRP